MILQALAIAAAALTPTLAIPPPDSGFPEAPNDTALTVAFDAERPDGGVIVDEAALYGINVTANTPQLFVDPTSYQSIQD